MLNALYQQTRNNIFETACDETLFSLVEKARDCGRVELAEKYTLEISNSVNISIQKSMEQAKNYKARGNDDIARQILDKLLSSNTAEKTNLYPALLLLQGEWLFQSVAELNSVICKDYFQLACEICEKSFSNHSSPEEIAKAYITLAEFADTQFQKLREHIQGELFREKAKLLQRSEGDIVKLQGTNDPDARKTLAILCKQFRMDKEEIQHTHNEKDRYQLMALDNYLKGLGLINKYDLFIFRVIALWLEASTGNQRVDVGPSKLDTAMKSKDIPSYKYIPVLHQLSGRLGTNSVATAALLDSILIKCAKEHPHQTLPVLLSQALLHKDKELTTKANPRTSDSSENRVKAARSLIEKLKREKKGNELSTLAVKMEFLWNALISFAYFKPTQKTTEQRHSIPSTQDLLRIEDITVPTLNIPTNQSGIYNDVVCVRKFSSFFHLVGGINAPKRLMCSANNGKMYNMLVKVSHLTSVCIETIKYRVT
ncbi:unnamed protein product [Allacma fusca]|uniref:Uncharacterized protein n=1 Tax=Allacma fusca TaxID=39272 RepID=A0A8J2P920_9HEXA|nr:unnamed protein product [Allacma fusca]